MASVRPIHAFLGERSVSCPCEKLTCIDLLTSDRRTFVHWLPCCVTSSGTTRLNTIDKINAIWPDRRNWTCLQQPPSIAKIDKRKSPSKIFREWTYSFRPTRCVTTARLRRLYDALMSSTQQRLADIGDVWKNWQTYRVGQIMTGVGLYNIPRDIFWVWYFWFQRAWTWIIQETIQTR